MRRRVVTVEYSEVAALAKALSSPLRRRILNALVEKEQSIQELTNALHIAQSSCTMNVQILERVGLISTRNTAGIKGSRKMCKVQFDEIILPVHSERRIEEDKGVTLEMPIGLYSDYDIRSPCGILGDSGMIGHMDMVETFLDPHRATAQLIWFTDGWVEYNFPLQIPSGRRVTSLSFSLELCSEFPGYNNNWPSDISLWIMGHLIATWRSPGDMGGSTGQLTPSWWNLNNTQFGYWKEWRVTEEGSFLDGQRMTDTTLGDLDLHGRSKIVIRIGIAEKAEFHGGINIFGRKFGNVPQDPSFSLTLV